MSTWMTDEEIEQLKKERPLTGNDFIDAYQLGYDQGIREMNGKLEKAETEKSNNYWGKYNAEKERDELKAEVERLKAKVKTAWNELFDAVEGKCVDYSKCIDYEEHEFQYTLMVKESRAEWVARTDGTKDSYLYEICGSDFFENIWIDAEHADEFKVWLAQEFRENLREAVEDWEKEKAKEEDDAE